MAEKENFFEKTLRKLREGGKSIGGPGESSRSSSGDSGEDRGIGLLFFLALVAHIYDYFTGFSRPGFMLYFYIAVIFFAFFYTFRMRIGGGETKILVLCAVAYILPYLTKLASDSNVNSKILLTIVGLIGWTPILVLYLGLRFPEGSLPRKLTIAYIFVLCLFIIFWVVSTYAPDQNTKVLIKNPSAGLKYMGSVFTKTFTKVGTSFSTTINRAVAQATGQPYEGDEESEAGIYIEDVHPLETTYSNESEVYVEAKIRAVNVKESYIVNTICFIDGVTQGIANPAIIYDVTSGYENIIGCNLGQLKTGTYDVKVRINFEYETTSDITYTFVNSNLKSDQYDKLGIESTTVATYTGGPVELGLPSLTQPLRITVDPKTNTQLSSYPFGVSLKNDWPQGKVVKGKVYVLDVPAEIKLVDCSRNPMNVSEPDPSTGRNTYRFEMNTTDARDSFDAVTCRMNLIDVKKLLGLDLKSVKTFAAKARYEYAVEETTTVEVEGN
jgi:hypothetical protein